MTGRTRNNWRSRGLLGVVLVAALAMFASACSDDDDGETTTEGGSETTAASTGVDDAAVEEVATLIERPTEITNTTPFDGEIPADKTIMWIQCPVPACVELGVPLKDAVEKLGWSLEIVSHDGTPESLKEAYAQAVREKPDGVVSSGYPRVMFEEELGQLAAADIPVIQVTVTDPPADGITAVINGPARNAEAGRQLGLYTAVESDGKANVLWVTTSYPIVVPTLDGADGEGGFKPTLEGLCDCPIESLDVPPEAIGVDSPARIVSALQANPDIDYVVSPLGDLFVGLPGALEDAGLADKVTLVTHDQNPTLSAAIEDGTIKAVVGFPGPEEMFQVTDTFLRYFADVEFSPNSDDFPSWIITKGHVPSTTENYPLVEDYQEQYFALWGVD
jgi:ribose transport system substrate-binding protein